MPASARRCFEHMRSEGLFHLLVRPELGGAGETPWQWFGATLAVAHADASAGWIVAQGAVQNAWLAVAADDCFAREYFALETITTSGAGERPAGNDDVLGAETYVVHNAPLALRVGLHPRRLRRRHGRDRQSRRNVGDPSRAQPVEAATILPTWDTLGLCRAPATTSTWASASRCRLWRTFTWPGLTVTRPGIDGNATTTFAAIIVSAAAVMLGVARRAWRWLPSPPSTNLAALEAALVEQPPFLRGFAGLHGRIDLATAGVRHLLDGCGAEPVTARLPTSSAEPAFGWPPPARSPLAPKPCVPRPCSWAPMRRTRSHPLERLTRDSQMLVHHVSVNAPSQERLEAVLLGSYRGPPASYDGLAHDVVLAVDAGECVVVCPAPDNAIGRFAACTSARPGCEVATRARRVARSPVPRRYGRSRWMWRRVTAAALAGAPKLFISYRRDDTSAFVAVLDRRLRQDLGSRNIFRDVRDLIAGERFEFGLPTRSSSPTSCSSSSGAVGGRDRRHGPLPSRPRRRLRPFGGAPARASTPDDADARARRRRNVPHRAARRHRGDRPAPCRHPHSRRARARDAPGYQALLVGTWVAKSRSVPNGVILLGDDSPKAKARLDALVEEMRKGNLIDVGQITRYRVRGAGAVDAQGRHLARKFPDVIVAIDDESADSPVLAARRGAARSPPAQDRAPDDRWRNRHGAGVAAGTGALGNLSPNSETPSSARQAERGHQAGEAVVLACDHERQGCRGCSGSGHARRRRRRGVAGRRTRAARAGRDVDDRRLAGHQRSPRPGRLRRRTGTRQLVITPNPEDCRGARARSTPFARSVASLQAPSRWNPRPTGGEVSSTRRGHAPTKPVRQSSTSRQRAVPPTPCSRYRTPISSR